MPIQSSLGFDMNNGYQFSGSQLANFYREMEMTYHLLAIGHLQANMEAEVINKMILQGLKTRLDQAKGLWMDS